MLQTFPPKKENAAFSEKEIIAMAQFIEIYIRHCPALIFAILEGAKKNGQSQNVIPFLEIVWQYFSLESDVIEDKLGFYGLMDDAYLAHSLLEAFSEQHRKKTGKGLLRVDMKTANTFIRLLIREPRSTFLDSIVSKTMENPKIDAILEKCMDTVDLSELTDPIWKDVEKSEGLLRSFIDEVGLL